MISTAVSSDDLPGGFNNIQKKTLLIIDDNPLIRRMLARVLSSEFDEVLVAEGPDQADQILECYTVTHMISDHDLGEGVPFGAALIPGWRKKYPSIKRVLIVTGSNIKGIDIPPEVDRVFAKSVLPSVLSKALKS